jgi:photosystem II stability/assembly factor-like uncharacterized protein
MRKIVFAASLLLIASSALAQSDHHVAARVPVQGNSREIGADRAAPVASVTTSSKISPTANPWKLQATLTGAVIHDISFPTAKIGYAAAELGQVWKTSNGGASWTEILNLGFPYYWYGVATLSANEVVISGFNDSNFEGIIRWSQDGGTTWSNDIVLTTSGWSFRTRFANSKNGLVMDGLSLNAPNAAHVTTDGGQLATDWTLVQPVDPNGGWFGNEFSLLPNLHARASGISYCSSTNGGSAWTCGPPIDSVFDGPVFFVNDKAGWVGGGEISPNVEGWLHRSTDGGTTWSGRTLDIGWPVRQIQFLTPLVGWAAGGNVYTGVGGMYYSADGGQTWSLDISTGAEMGACDSKHSGKNYQVWCAGYNSSFNGVVYTLKGTL